MSVLLYSLVCVFAALFDAPRNPGGPLAYAVSRSFSRPLRRSLKKVRGIGGRGRRRGTRQGPVSFEYRWLADRLTWWGDQVTRLLAAGYHGVWFRGCARRTTYEDYPLLLEGTC